MERMQHIRRGTISLWSHCKLLQVCKLQGTPPFSDKVKFSLKPGKMTMLSWLDRNEQSSALHTLCAKFCIQQSYLRIASSSAPQTRVPYVHSDVIRPAAPPSFLYPLAESPHRFYPLLDHGQLRPSPWAPSTSCPRRLESPMERTIPRMVVHPPSTHLNPPSD